MARRTLRLPGTWIPPDAAELAVAEAEVVGVGDTDDMLSNVIQS